MYSCIILLYFFFFKQKTAYEVRISDWSSDVCSSDLQKRGQVFHRAAALLRFVADIDLDETVRTPAGLFHRDGERRHQRRPVDRMDGVEQPDCVYRLVGLKLPDQMQFNIGIDGLQLRPFRLRLLHPVPAEHTLTGVHARADRTRRVRLRYCADISRGSV